MKLTFAYWGNYTIAFKSLFKKLGFDVVAPEKTNPVAIREGAKISPEMYCFPLKVNMGNYLAAIKKGADTIFMVTNISGSCRLRYYGVVQEKVLKERGYKVNFIIFGQNPKDMYLKLKELSGASFWRILKAIYFVFKELRFIEKLEKKAQYLRPREKIKGKTDEILRLAFENLDHEMPTAIQGSSDHFKIETLSDLRKFKKEIFQKLSKIEIDRTKDIPRVALIGEIYTVTDGSINFGIEEKLGKEGIEVHREMDVTYHLKKTIFPWKDWQIQKKITPYLQSTVGGHGRDAIYEMLNYVKKDFDGIIHLLPFGCFVKDTNITVDGYLQKPIQEIKIGEKILTHKGRFKKVTQIHRGVCRGKILKIDCGGKLKISLTPGHPILLAKTFIKGSGRKEIQDHEFIPASQAKKGDFIALPIPLKNKINNPVLRDPLLVQINQPDIRFHPYFKKIDRFVLKPDLLRLIGYYLAEGNIIRRVKRNWQPEGIVFGFNIKEKEYVKDTVNIIKQNFSNLTPKVKKYPNRHVTTVEIYSKSLAEYFQYLCGSHADKKILSSELINLEPSLQKEILKGFFRGDGCFTDKYGETTYRGVTTSRDLASQLFWLLIRNRIKPSLMEQHIKNRKLSYMIKIANAEGIKRLGDERLKVTNRKNYVRFRELKDYFLVPIRKIETANFRGKVYTLTVEDDHSYVANFLVAKNCMPETTVRPILQKIHQESGIPFLSLSLDEQVAEAGINTRLEAFVDVVNNYYHNKKH